MDVIHAEIQLRWQQMFTLLVAGDDIPPALRLRTEGLMEAAAMAEVASAGQLDEELDELFQLNCGQAMGEVYGERWRDFYPFPQLPLTTKRAPVYPSTSD